MSVAGTTAALSPCFAEAPPPLLPVGAGETDMDSTVHCSERGEGVDAALSVA